jgi:hypothetical protein
MYIGQQSSHVQNLIHVLKDPFSIFIFKKYELVELAFPNVNVNLVNLTG